MLQRGGVRSLSLDTEAEGTEVAQVHNLALQQLLRNQVQQDFQAGGQVSGAHRGYLGAFLGQATLVDTAAASHHGVVAMRRFRVARVAAGITLYVTVILTLLCKGLWRRPET
jgi:hypothetical protein